MLETRIGDLSPSMIDAQRNQAQREAWQDLIDRNLLTWLRNPSDIEDDGFDAPSPTILRLSLDLAERFREEGLPAPDSIVPDPNGGIVFQRREGNVSEMLHVWDDGSVEYMCFHGTTLAERQPLRY